MIFTNMVHHRKDKELKRDMYDLAMERAHLLSEDSDFFFREAYKTLRSNVTFALAGERKCKVLAVTSAFQGEGKSFTAVNLAVSYAQADKRVLLIDGDLRRPKLGRLLDQYHDLGLSNILAQPELTDKAIIPSNREPNMDLLLAGDIPPNPSELLGSKQMVTLVRELRQKYEVIILDTAPVNVVTDAAVVSSVSDGVLFIVRAGVSERGMVQRAMDQLKYANAKVLGFVLNGAQSVTGQYGGRYRNKHYRKYLSGSSSSMKWLEREQQELEREREEELTAQQTKAGKD